MSDARSWILHGGTYICVSSVWNLRHAALLAPRILWWYLDIFWDNVGIANTLRAGRSGDRIPVRTRISVSSRLVPRPTQPSKQRVIRSFQGVKRSKRVTDTQPPRSSGLRVGWNCTFVLHLSLHKHVVGLHFPSLLKQCAHDYIASHNNSTVPFITVSLHWDWLWWWGG
jgi:hypothetical protein